MDDEQNSGRLNGDLPSRDASSVIANENNGFRVYIADFLIVTFGVALGFAGRHWMAAESFTSLFAGIFVFGGIFHIFRPPRTRWTAIIWVAVTAAFFASQAVLPAK